MLAAATSNTFTQRLYILSMTSSMLSSGSFSDSRGPRSWSISHGRICTIHHEEGADACRGLFSDPVGKEYAVQLPVPVNICFFHLITEFCTFQEGPLCCSVKSLHFIIGLVMIGTCDVMSNACELIKLVSDLESITKKKNKIHGHTQIAW